MPRLEPESQRLLQEVLPAYTPTPGMSVEEARALALGLGKRLQGEPAPMERVEDHHVNGAGRVIPVRFYRSGPGKGWLLWLHGGGFMTGGLDSHDLLCRRLAQQSGLAVISVDYCLAPEHPGPAAALDCLAVLEWIFATAAALGLDPDQGAVGGSSAGGNLAAVTALQAKARGLRPLRALALIYPCVDASQRDLATAPHGTGYQLTTGMMQRYWQAYLVPGQDPTDPMISPLFAPDLAGLPPVLLQIAELDPLAPEIRRFRDRLEQAGTRLRCSHWPGVMHGFFAQAGVLSLARDAQAEVAAFLQQHCG